MDSYRIASFNLHKFSTNSKKKLDVIARIIRDNDVDILAVQEIFSEEAKNNLVYQLNELGQAHWEGCWESPNSKSVSAAEGYAFIWNKGRIELSRNRSGKIFKPTIHNQYPHRDGTTLIRNPYYGRFVVKQNRMIEFRLINTHIMFSLNREENESDDHDTSIGREGAVAMRNKEFDVLASKILPKLDDKVYDYQWDEKDDFCRRPYTILLGDYNLNLKISPAKDTFIDKPIIVIRDSISEKSIVTVQEELTTLKAKRDETQPCGYRNNFDHFTYDENRPITTKCWAVDVPNDFNYKDIGFEQYREGVSDHLMIVMEINFT